MNTTSLAYRNGRRIIGDGIHLCMLLNIYWEERGGVLLTLPVQNPYNSYKVHSHLSLYIIYSSIVSVKMMGVSVTISIIYCLYEFGHREIKIGTRVCTNIFAPLHSNHCLKPP